jgi:transposase
MWYAGIDWADQHHDVAVIDEMGHPVATRRVNHSAEGLDELKAFLLGITAYAGAAEKVPHPEQIACIIETSRGLLIVALLEAGFAVYPVNPKTLDRRRAAAGAKTDAIDAYLLAKKGRSDFHDLRRLAPDSPLVAELKALTRDQDLLVHEQTRLVNQLTACLKAYYPVALELFTKLQQPLTLAFLQRYATVEAAQAASVDELAAFLRQQYPSYRGPAKAAQKLWETLHRPQLRADAITTRTKARLMLALVGQLEPLLGQIAAYDAEIQRLFRNHPDSDLFLSLPGAGRRLAPRLLAEWGDDRERYAQAENVQSVAGTCPVPFQSGNYAHARKRKACIKPFRNVLHLFAMESVQKEEWAAAYYRQKRQQGKSHSVATRALANVWVRILYAAWSRHTRYEPAIFLEARKSRAPVA